MPHGGELGKLLNGLSRLIMASPSSDISARVCDMSSSSSSSVPSTSASTTPSTWWSDPVVDQVDREYKWPNARFVWQDSGKDWQPSGKLNTNDLAELNKHAVALRLFFAGRIPEPVFPRRPPGFTSDDVAEWLTANRSHERAAEMAEHMSAVMKLSNAGWDGDIGMNPPTPITDAYKQPLSADEVEARKVAAAVGAADKALVDILIAKWGPFPTKAEWEQLTVSSQEMWGKRVHGMVDVYHTKTRWHVVRRGQAVVTPDSSVERMYKLLDMCT